jgi:polyferredoxin
MDLNKLSPGEKIIAGSGVALVIFSFLPWFGLGGGSHSAWSNPLSSFGVLIGIVMLAQIAIARFTTAKLPKPPVPWGQVHLILGVLAFALILLQAIIGDKVGALGFSVTLDRKFGLFLGLLAAAGLAYGGFMRSKEPEVSPGLLP